MQNSNFYRNMQARGFVRSAQAAAIMALLERRGFCKVGGWGESLFVRQLPLFNSAQG